MKLQYASLIITFFSFYASVPPEADNRAHCRELALQHGHNFLMLSSQAHDASLYVDATPWAYYLMKFALECEELDAFKNIAYKFYVPCVIVYGLDDSWIKVFEQVLKALAEGKTSKIIPALPTSGSNTVVVPRLQQQWLSNNMVVCQRIIGTQGTKPLDAIFSVKPWQN
eukprot:Blabericola_migrator_1__5618@NODE_2858_length_2274_cov_82_594472_g1794_i0_p3_GENE_NODE_2858_length_2274_cov_82_594472_g1794_i0NODE_2858_length_2274_cov_82_594472_g1794_i0_p3_ORF_typecomplete_len169_score20_21_NODE_2858_length_2274_cov_82_594472_g1794_i050556